MKVDEDLKCERLDVSGAIKVGGGVEGGDVEVSGTIKARRIVAGSFVLSGAATAEEIVGGKVDIGRKSRVRGTIIGGKVRIRKKAEVEVVEGIDVKVERGAEVDEVRYVEKADIDQEAEVGEVKKIEKLSEEIPV